MSLSTRPALVSHKVEPLQITSAEMSHIWMLSSSLAIFCSIFRWLDFFQKAEICHMMHQHERGICSAMDLNYMELKSVCYCQLRDFKLSIRSEINCFIFKNHMMWLLPV